MRNQITFGETRQQMQLGDITVTETIHPPGLRLRPHDHCNANVNVVLGGQFVESVERTPFQCGRGSLIFKPEGARHSNEYSVAGAHCIAIEIPERLLTRFAGEPFQTTSLRAVDLATTIIREMAGHDGCGSDLIVEGLVYELLGTALRDEGDAGAPALWLRQAEDFIDQSLSSALSLGGLAARVGRHPSHLARAFRRVHGVSVGQYVRQRRITVAMRLLRGSDMTIAEIALQTGFSDQSHLTNTFRRLIGTTPRLYRDSSRRPRHRSE